MPYRDKEKQKEYQRQRQARERAKHKTLVFEMFGYSCMDCGYDNVLALQLDHVVPIKRQSFDTRGTDTGAGLWRRVALGILPKSDFRLLCANCHSIKTYNDSH